MLYGEASVTDTRLAREFIQQPSYVSSSQTTIQQQHGPSWPAPEKSLDVALQIKLQKRFRNLNNAEYRKVLENPVMRKYSKLPQFRR